MKSCIYIGTVGTGVWSSTDFGGSWNPAFGGKNLVDRVWSFSWHPKDPDVVWGGTDRGIVRQDASGAVHEIASPFSDRQVWAMVQSPHNPKLMLAGTRPGAIFRTQDGGLTWEDLSVDIAQECHIGMTRITRIRFDPMDEATYWVAVEVDAVHVTRDHGKSWEKLENGFEFPDIHDLAICNEHGSRKLLAATALGLYSSKNDGQTWEWQKLDTPWQYTRGLELASNANGSCFLGVGDGPPGTTGRLLRSRDWGLSWERSNIPQPTNSTMWNIAVNVADPSLVYASTIKGQVFRSSDSGASWVRLEREFTDTRTLLWHPV